MIIIVSTYYTRGPSQDSLNDWKSIQCPETLYFISNNCVVAADRRTRCIYALQKFIYYCRSPRCDLYIPILFMNTSCCPYRIYTFGSINIVYTQYLLYYFVGVSGENVTVIKFNDQMYLYSTLRDRLADICRR